MKDITRKQISVILLTLVVSASLVIMLTEGNIKFFYGTNWTSDTMAFRIAAVFGTAVPYAVILVLLNKLTTKGQFIVAILTIFFGVARISEAFRYFGETDHKSLLMGLQIFNLTLGACLSAAALKGATEAKAAMNNASSNNIKKESE